MSNEALELTPARTYKSVREQGVLQKLPSGRVVSMRNVTPRQLLGLGKIPDILTSLTLRTLYGQADLIDVGDFALNPREEAKDAAEMLDSLRVVCTAALVYPRVVDEPSGDDEIHIDDLAMIDQSQIFQLAFMEAEALSRFRYEPGANVENVPGDAGDAQPTEPVDGD